MLRKTVLALALAAALPAFAQTHSHNSTCHDGSYFSKTERAVTGGTR